MEFVSIREDFQVADWQILIDGYNLLHASGLLATRHGARSLLQARQALLQHLSTRLSAEERCRVVIVFDAGPKSPRDMPDHLHHQGMRVLFAHGHADADELLEQLIRQAPKPAKTTVVSSDLRLQRAATRRGARAVGSDAWLYELLSQPVAAESPVPDELKPVPGEQLSKDEIDHWLQQFTQGSDDT